jgi:GNAT superfamily N-acetyltransferase
MNKKIGIHISKASGEDIMCIHDMAQVVFRHTYREILSPEQMEYMMEWMYSPENLQKQLDEGHVYYIAYRDGKACGYVSVQPEGIADDGRLLFHLQKIYVLPSEQGHGLGRALFDRAVAHVREAALAREVAYVQEVAHMQEVAHACEVAGGCTEECVEGCVEGCGVRIELNVNRNNPSIGFYHHLGLRILRQGDFHIGNGYYMNDYIMGLEV